jgi:hypothetical protein
MKGNEPARTDFSPRPGSPEAKARGCICEYIPGVCGELKDGVYTVNNEAGSYKMDRECLIHNNG